MENGNGTWCNGGHGLNMTWLLKKVNRRRIDAFERWCWRRLLRTARITNQEILDRIKPWTSLEARVTKQKLLYFGAHHAEPVPGERHHARAGKWKEGERSPKNPLAGHHQKWHRNDWKAIKGNHLGSYHLESHESSSDQESMSTERIERESVMGKRVGSTQH